MDPSREQQLVEQYGPREAMEYDVVIVGAGPAGLGAAIRLKQLAAEKGQDVSDCVLEKGSEVGAHILSGAVMDPRAIDELMPDWKEKGAPLNVPVSEDRFLFLSETGSTKTPNWMLPGIFQNHGNFVISLGNVVRWMGQQAEALGVEIFPGFPAAQVLYDGAGAVRGVVTGDLGIGKDGEPTGEFQLGMELHAKYVLFAEGSRGNLGKLLIEKFALAADSDPQTYGIGIKELWEIDPAKHQPGLVMHTAGMALNTQTYGGSFLYHLDNNQVVVGFVVGLAYTQSLSVAVRGVPALQDASRGPHLPRRRQARLVRRPRDYRGRTGFAAEAGLPGGALIGCDAGFLNAARIKGSHTAIKSGMLAAEAAYQAVISGRAQDELSAYPAAYRASWLHEELQKTRNFKQWMSKGLYLGTMMVGFEQKVLGGNVPWTLHHKHADHECLKPAAQCEPIVYPKPDGKLTFDRLSSVFISNTNHAENQPSHLTLRDPTVPVRINLAEYAGPGKPLLPGRRLRIRTGGRRRRAAADQRAELRALQDLRHQGPDAEHRVGDARGWGWAELPEHVSEGQASNLGA